MPSRCKSSGDNDHRQSRIVETRLLGRAGDRILLACRSYLLAVNHKLRSSMGMKIFGMPILGTGPKRLFELSRLPISLVYFYAYAAIFCFASCFVLPTAQAQAGDTLLKTQVKLPGAGSTRAPSRSHPPGGGQFVLLSENSNDSNYEGATLPPPPPRQANQSGPNSGRTGDDMSPQKHRGKNNKNAIGSAVNKQPDADMPSNPKTQEFANEKQPQPGPERHPGQSGQAGQKRGIFSHGPLDLTPLNLTEEQKQKIQQMRSENVAKARDLMRKRRDLGGQMKDALFDPDSTAAQIKAKRDELRQVQEKLEDIRLDDMLSIRSVLTPDQKLKLRTLKEPSAQVHPGSGPTPPVGEGGLLRRRPNGGPPLTPDEVKSNVSEASANTK